MLDSYRIVSVSREHSEKILIVTTNKNLKMSLVIVHKQQRKNSRFFCWDIALSLSLCLSFSYCPCLSTYLSNEYNHADIGDSLIDEDIHVMHFCRCFVVTAGLYEYQSEETV